MDESIRRHIAHRHSLATGSCTKMTRMREERGQKLSQSRVAIGLCSSVSYGIYSLLSQMQFIGDRIKTIKAAS